jgi:hypothetical protein
MPVIYNNKKIIPVTRISFQKAYATRGDGKKIGKIFNITMQAELVAFKGSPNSSKVFWELAGYPPDETLSTDARLSAIIRKQEAIRDLFATEGATFEVQGYDGAAPLKFNPRIKSVNFPEGQWFDRCPYTVEMEADVVYVNGTDIDEDATLNDYKISSFNEEWNFDPADEENITFNLTRRLSAKGKRFYNSDGTISQDAWKNARDYIINGVGLGLDSTQLQGTGVYNFTNLQAYNYVRKQSINESDGEFSVTESWLAYNPGTSSYGAIENYTITKRTNIQDGLTSVSIDGSIKGLEKRNNTTYGLISSKYTQASGRYTEVEGSFFTRVSNFAGVTLNSTPTSTNKTDNTINGTINYTKEYNNRPVPSLSGVLSEVFTVTYDNPAEIVVEQPVIGRLAGPVLQSLDVYTSRKKSLTIEAVYPPTTTDVFAERPATDVMTALFTPSASFVKRIRDTESYTPNTGRYSRNVTWIYEV